MNQRKNVCVLNFFVFVLGVLFFCIASYFLYTHVGSDQPHQDVDSKAYLANAELFYHNNSFTWPASASGKFPYYTLGYAFVLGVLFKIFGQHLILAILVQILLSLLCALLIFDTTRKIAGRTAGYIAYLLMCANLGFLVFSQFILAEIWLAFFLILFFHRLVSFMKSKSSFTLVQAALSLSISVLIKPAALYFWPLLIPCLWICSKNSFKQFLLFCLVWCAAFYVPLAGYALHNKLVFNRWYVCALDHENMIYWFFPNVLAYKYGTDQNQERIQLRLRSSHDAHKKFIQELKTSPHLFLIVWLKNVAKTWLGLFSTNLKVLIEQNVHGGDISYFKTQGSLFGRVHAYVSARTIQLWVIIIGYIEILWSMLRFILCLVGMLWVIMKRSMLEVYVMTVYLAYFSLITGHDGCSRFRMLFEWLLIILAALGIWFLCLNFRQKLSAHGEEYK